MSIQKNRWISWLSAIIITFKLVPNLLTESVELWYWKVTLHNLNISAVIIVKSYFVRNIRYTGMSELNWYRSPFSELTNFWFWFFIFKSRKFASLLLLLLLLLLILLFLLLLLLLFLLLLLLLFEFQHYRVNF